MEAFEAILPKKNRNIIPLVGKSLFLFSEQNKIRRLTDAIVSHWLFDNIIIVLIVISTMTLAFEEPLQDPKSDTMKVI